MSIIRAKLWSIAVLIVVSLCAGYLYYLHLHAENVRVAAAAAAAAARAQAQQAETLRNVRAMAEKAGPLPDKAMNDALPKSYPRPPSEWQATEKSIYQKFLSGGHFDVLVVPFQVQEYALDRPTRSLMTAELALAISTAQKISIPDPYLVARALGDGERRLDAGDVYSLAEKVGAKKIIWGYVGHNRKNQMSLTVQFQERSANGLLNAQTTFVTKNFERIAFSDEHPPIEVYQPLLREIVSAVGLDGPLLPAPKAEELSDAVELPPSPQAMIREKTEPARDAYYFQVLAYLAPDSAERTRERFVEKSFLAISSMSPEFADYRVLKARALMMLGLRPAALRVLVEPKTAEEKELVAVLNGNLPDVEALASQVRPGVRRLMAQLDAGHLGNRYGANRKNRSMSTAAALKLPGKIWPFIAVRAFSDSELSAQFDNIYLKQLLDDEYPVKDYTAEGMLRGIASLGNAERLQHVTDLAVVNHIRKLMESDPEKWCCLATLMHPGAMDYLNLIEAMSEDNLMRHARFLTQIQDAPDRALEFLSQIENVYKGNPQFSVLRAEAQVRKASAVDGAEKESLLKSAYEDAFGAMYWEQGQTVTAADAFELIRSSGRQDYGYFDNLYAGDYPFRAHYPNWEQGSRPEPMTANAEAALRNSTSDLKPLSYLDREFVRTHQASKHDALFKKVEGRFNGNPELYRLLAANSHRMGDEQAAEKYYRESIRLQPGSWGAHMALGSLLIERGQPGKAAKLLMSYPAFSQGSNEKPVVVSNLAYEAGSKFYWMGEFSLATPFYVLASRHETGSDAELTSRLRLALISGDYRGALSDSLERARRFNDPSAYRDYLGLLHAMGASKEAWDAFNVLADQLDDPHIWETALVGHRKEGKAEGEIAAWVKQEVTHNIGKQANCAARYLVRAGVTDRTPTKELASSLADVELPVYREAGRVVQPAGNGGVARVLGPHGSGGALPVNFPDGASPKARIKSDLVYFAESYRSLRTGDVSSALALLREAAALYDLSVEESSYLLPYYAFAAAKNGDASAVERYIRDFDAEQKGFDYFLAKAIISGINGRIEDSLGFLKGALYRRKSAGNRPLQTEYQYAEICEWLYETTGKSKYREMALDWARKNQKFQPWFAWAYAMEARLSSGGAARKRAIAMAFYLDPQSDRLGKIPKREREAAIKELKGTNPFLKMGDSSAQPRPGVLTRP